MSATIAASRARTAVRLGTSFAIGYVVVAGIFLIPVANDAITLREWFRGMLWPLITPYLAIPLLFAGFALLWPEDRTWLRVAQVAFVLWWLVIAAVLGTGV